MSYFLFDLFLCPPVEDGCFLKKNGFAKKNVWCFWQVTKPHGFELIPPGEGGQIDGV